MEKSYEELQEELDDLMEKIDESMTMTRKQQKDLDKMEKAMMNESKPMKLESRKAEFTEKGQYKTEFDEMTKNALINAQKNIIVLRKQTENAYQEMLMETVRKQNFIKDKLKSMKERDLTSEKLELVEESARKALEKTNEEMFEFQKQHFEQRATLNNYEDSIKKYAREIGVEKELNEINPKQVIEEFNEAKNKAEKPEQDKPEQDKPEQDKPEQDKPEQDKPEQDKPEQDKPEQDKPEQDKPEQDKPEQDKPEQDKPEQDKPEQDKPEQDKPEQDKPETEKPASGNPVPGTPTPGNSGPNGIEEIVLENNAEEFSRNCSLEEFKKEIFEDVDFVKAIFETAPQEKKDAIIKGMYEHPKMDRRLLYRITHDKNATPEKFKAYTDIVATNGELKRFSEKEVEELNKQLPLVTYDLKKRNGVKFAERYDNYQDALKTQELFEKMGFEDKVEVKVGWLDKALFGLKTKWDKFIENRDKDLLLTDGSERENTEPENTETSSLRDEIKVKANPEPQKSEPAPVEAKEQENEER